MQVTDPQSGPTPRYVRWALPWLNDPRDLVFVAVMCQCALVSLFGIGLYFSGRYLWYLAPVYWVVGGVWVVDRFILMLHCTSHRQLFKARHRMLNQIIPWALGPFCGETPEAYFVHHMGMHHREENLPPDLSSTMKYHRHRLGHWLRYWVRFMTVGIVDLFRYHRRNGNRRLLRRLVTGEGTYWVVILALLFLKPAATFVVFLVPLFLVRTLMMVGNWGQHAFICQQEPENPYRSSITCLNTRYNRRCFNDGYHIFHHVQARSHWTEMPGEFERNLSVYGAQDAIVFNGIDFFQVWAFLMLGRWRRLAAAFVQLPGAPARDETSVIAFLKSRTAPFPLTATTGAMEIQNPTVVDRRGVAHLP